MKICYLTHDVNPKGGWGRLSTDIIRAASKAGHEITILTQVGDGKKTFPVLSSGLTFSSVISARKFIKHCDIIHAIDGYPFSIVAALANFGLGKRLVVTLVGTYSVAPLYSAKLNFLQKWAYRRAAKITSISKFTKQEVLKKVALPDIEIINPGIDYESFRREHLDSGERFILSVGALKFRKGYHVSIPAFAKVKKQIPNLKYKIVGSQRDVNYFERLQRLTRDLEVENDVEFISNITDDELARLYQTAQLFVLTSINHGHHFEGFGIVFLEAAASGLPCVGTRSNGIEDAVIQGANGFLVEQGDVKRTAAAMTKILNDPTSYKEFSKSSSSWAAMNDNSVKNLKQYSRIYQNLSNNV